MIVEKAKRCQQDCGEWRRSGVFLLCDSLFECGVGVGALDLLTVTTRNSGVTTLRHPETSSRNSRALQKTSLIINCTHRFT
jgi:hypothetical protein